MGLRMARALAFWIVVLAGLAGCSGSWLHAEQTRDVALGWEGRVTLWPTPCRPVAAHPTKVVPTSTGWYRAVAVGTEDFACGDDVVHVRVSRAVRLKIEYPKRVAVGEPHAFDVVGYDGAGRKLDLGGGYMWRLDGVLENVPCGDTDIVCALAESLAPDGSLVRGQAAGTGRVTAYFGGVRATLSVVAVPASLKHVAPPGLSP